MGMGGADWGHWDWGDWAWGHQVGALGALGLEMCTGGTGNTGTGIANCGHWENRAEGNWDWRCILGELEKLGVGIQSGGVLGTLGLEMCTG